MTPPLPLQGRLLHSASPNGNTCVSGTSSCVLVGSREPLHGCMGGDGPRPHRRGKGWRKPLLILRCQIRVSAVRFYASLSLSSPPRKMRKNEQQRLTSVAVVMAVRRPPWCIAVYSWSFVLILCYFVYLDVRARVVRVRARKYVFVHFCTNETRSRGFTH